MKLKKSRGSVAWRSASTEAVSRSPINFQTMSEWQQGENEFVPHGPGSLGACCNLRTVVRGDGLDWALDILDVDVANGFDGRFSTAKELSDLTKWQRIAKAKAFN